MDVLTIIGIFIGGIILAVLVGYSVSIYNQLVRLRERVDQAKQNIDVVLQQRQDQLESLIDTVSSYMEHEATVLQDLTDAREAANNAESPKEQATADAMVQEALGKLEVRAEDYPELKSSENMMQLQEEIASLEGQLADRRELYNEAVTIYNMRIQQLPYVFVAQTLGYTDKELFEAEGSASEPVDVGTRLKQGSSTLNKNG